MFEKNTKPYTDLLGKTNRIVEGTKITGNIESIADFRLDGHLFGNFSSQGKLVIGPTGKVIGDINCTNADIEGYYEGTIIVEEMLTVKSNAVIKGNVNVSKLAIEPGAEFQANCQMTTPQNIL